LPGYERDSNSIESHPNVFGSPPNRTESLQSGIVSPLNGIVSSSNGIVSPRRAAPLSQHSEGDKMIESPNPMVHPSCAVHEPIVDGWEWKCSHNNRDNEITNDHPSPYTPNSKLHTRNPEP